MPKVIELLSITHAQTCLTLLQVSFYLFLSVSLFCSPSLIHLKFITLKVSVLKINALIILRNFSSGLYYKNKSLTPSG